MSINAKIQQLEGAMELPIGIGQYNARISQLERAIENLPEPTPLDSVVEFVFEEDLGEISSTSTTASTVKVIDLSEYNHNYWLVVITNDQESGYLATYTVIASSGTTVVKTGINVGRSSDSIAITQGATVGVYVSSYNASTKKLSIARKYSSEYGAINGNYYARIYKINIGE